MNRSEKESKERKKTKMKFEYCIVAYIVFTAITYLLYRLLYLFRSEKCSPYCFTCLNKEEPKPIIKLKFLAIPHKPSKKN